MDRDIIEALENVKRRITRLGGFPEEAEVVADAIALLKAQEPRVMALEEVFETGCVFLEDSKVGVLCLLTSVCDEEEVVFMSRRADEIRRITKKYNVTWRCWTSRPTDAQREAVKWE